MIAYSFVVALGTLQVMTDSASVFVGMATLLGAMDKSNDKKSGHLSNQATSLIRTL